MNINEQKEFIEGILNYHKYKENEKDKIDLPSIMSQLSEKLGTSNSTEFVREDGLLDVDALSQYSENIGMEPIDIVEFAFDELQNLKSFSHLGQTVDLSSANERLEYAKKQFKEYKKSEDINNF